MSYLGLNKIKARSLEKGFSHIYLGNITVDLPI